MRLVDVAGKDWEDKPREAAGTMWEDTQMDMGRNTWMFDMLLSWVGKKDREIDMMHMV